MNMASKVEEWEATIAWFWRVPINVARVELNGMTYLCVRDLAARAGEARRLARTVGDAS